MARIKTVEELTLEKEAFELRQKEANFRREQAEKLSEKTVNKLSLREISDLVQKEIYMKFKEENLEVNLSGGLLKVNNVSGDADEYLEEIKEDIDRRLRRDRNLRVMKADIDIEVNLYIKELSTKKEKEITEFLSFYDPSLGLTELTKFLDILKLKNTDPSNPPLELDVLVHAHMLQQIKKKFLFRGEIIHAFPIAPCWFGYNGTGKSWGIRFLAEKTSTSLMPLWVSRVGDSIRDNRNQYAIYSSYILLLDDITEVHKETIGLLRNIITDKTSNIRKMNKNKGTNIRNNSTVFMSSNSSLADIFQDTNEVRRYWQYNCLDTLPKDLEINVYSKFNAINYNEIWHSISLTTEYLSSKIFQEKVYPYQEKWLLASHPINQFIKDYGFFNTDLHKEYEETIEITLGRLFKDYQLFLTATNRKTVMSTAKFQIFLANYQVFPKGNRFANTRPDAVKFLVNKTNWEEFESLMSGAEKSLGSTL